MKYQELGSKKLEQSRFSEKPPFTPPRIPFFRPSLLARDNSASPIATASRSPLRLKPGAARPDISKDATKNLECPENISLKQNIYGAFMAPKRRRHQGHRHDQPEASFAAKDHSGSLARRKRSPEKDDPRPPWRSENNLTQETLMAFLIQAIACFCLLLFAGAPAFAACALTKVAEMPLIELGAHYAVMARIGDVVRPMIVDTGAEDTTLRLSVADELKLTQDSSLSKVRAALGIGQTKADVYLNVIPSILAFGDLVYRDRSTPVSRIDWGNSPENDSAGLLGDDILSKFDVEFDFPSKKLTFYRAFGCYGTFTPWTGAFSSIPFVHERAKITVDVILNEERTRAIVDTGNPLSIVSRRALAFWGIPDSAFSNSPGKIGTPLNGGTAFALKMFLFDKVKIGNEIFSRPVMSVADFDFQFGSANLGLDYWKNLKVWISYRNNWMFLSNKASTTTIAYPVDTEPAAAAGVKNAAGKNDVLGKIASTDASPEEQMAPDESPSSVIAVATPEEATLHRSVMKDTTAWLLPVYSVEENCESSVPTVSFPKPPDHGVASLEVRDRHTTYPAGNPLEKCNALKIPMLVIKYAPTTGYAGDDTLTVDELFPDGKHKVRRIDVMVD